MSVIGNSDNSLASTLSAVAKKLRDDNSAPHKKKTDPGQTILDRLAATDPAKADEFNRQQAQLKQTIQQLQSSKSSINDQRKEAARQKIERIKAEIQALKMLAGSDPKAAAREAARLSRELSAAVKEYSSASQGSGATSTPSPTSTGQVIGGQIAATAEQTAPQSVAESPADAAPSTDAAKPATDAENQETGHDAQSAAFRERIEQQISEIKKHSGDQTDNDFILGVRRLAAELKAIINAARQKLQQRHDQNGLADLSKADKALTAVDTSLNEIGANALSASAPIINIFT